MSLFCVFCSIGLQVCFCASTTLFLLLWLCYYILKLGLVMPATLLYKHVRV